MSSARLSIRTYYNYKYKLGDIFKCVISKAHKQNVYRCRWVYLFVEFLITLAEIFFSRFFIKLYLLFRLPTCLSHTKPTFMATVLSLVEASCVYEKRAFVALILYLPYVMIFSDRRSDFGWRNVGKTVILYGVRISLIGISFVEVRWSIYSRLDEISELFGDGFVFEIDWFFQITSLGTVRDICFGGLWLLMYWLRDIFSSYDFFHVDSNLANTNWPCKIIWTREIGLVFFL